MKRVATPADGHTHADGRTVFVNVTASTRSPSSKVTDWSRRMGSVIMNARERHEITEYRLVKNAATKDMSEGSNGLQQNTVRSKADIKRVRLRINA